MQAWIELKTLPIDRKWFCTSVVIYNNITKCFYSFVASYQSGTLPYCRGKAKAAWVNGHNPGGVGTGPSCRERRCTLCRWPQEGGPHHHCGPAGGGKVLVAQPAGGPGHGHVSVKRLLQQRRHWRHEEPGWQLDVRHCRPASPGKTNKGANSRRGPGQDEGVGHARDPRPRGVERVRGAEQRKVQG
jgi:hypothetical protein